MAEQENKTLPTEDKEQNANVFKAEKEPNPPGTNKGCMIYLVAFAVMLILSAIMTYL